MSHKLFITEATIEYCRRFGDLISPVIVSSCPVERALKQRHYTLRAMITIISSWTSCCISPDIISTTPSDDRRGAGVLYYYNMYWKVHVLKLYKTRLSKHEFT